MYLRNLLAFSAACVLIFPSCKNTEAKKEDNSAIQQRVQAYLDTYNKEFQRVLYADNLAQWTLQTHIVEGDTVSQHIADSLDEVFAAFAGSAANIDSTKKFLQWKDQLSDLQVRQLNAILFQAGNTPATASDIVKKRIAAQNKQVKGLYGFKFRMNGKEVTPNWHIRIRIRKIVVDVSELM